MSGWRRGGRRFSLDSGVDEVAMSDKRGRRMMKKKMTLAQVQEIVEKLQQRIDDLESELYDTRARVYTLECNERGVPDWER